MNAAPEGKSVQKTIQKFQRMPEVTKVQEIKVWSISKGKNILTAKIEVKNIGNNTLKILQDKARSLKFMHSTIEMI
jgi:Co/Zn/Cd efflux system component